MKNFLLKLKVKRDTRGQDLIEYALMAGFVAVAAGAVFPNLAESIWLVFARVWINLACAGGDSEACSLVGVPLT